MTNKDQDSDRLLEDLIRAMTGPEATGHTIEFVADPEVSGIEKRMIIWEAE